MLWRTLVNAIAVLAATWLMGGIHFDADDSTSSLVATLAIVSILIGLLNALVKPILTIITSCLMVITFGLFVWVINAVILRLASQICYGLGVGWYVEGWGSAFGGALIISIVSMFFGRDRTKTYGSRQ
jgi:putative membrane protein